MSRILYILDEFSPKSETFVYQQILNLAKNHQVFVLCNKRLNQEVFPFKNFKEFIPQKRNIWTSLLNRKIFIRLKNKETEKQIIQIRSSFKPTSIVFHFGPSFLKYIYNIGSIDIPVFVLFHGYDVSSLVRKSKTYTKSMQKALKLNNVYPIAISQAIKLKMQEAFKINKEINVCYLGVDTKTFHPKNPQTNNRKKIFIQISRLVEKKGLRYTIHAFKKLTLSHPEKGFTFLIIGDGPLRELLEIEVQKLGLDENIQFLGFQNQAKIAEYLRQSDVYIQNSITAKNGDTEGLPISIMEAMATNLPVIVSRHSGIPELVDTSNGLLTEEKSIDSILQALIKIWSFTSVNNREKIIEYFSIDKSIEYFLTVIQTQENR